MRFARQPRPKCNGTNGWRVAVPRGRRRRCACARPAQTSRIPCRSKTAASRSARCPSCCATRPADEKKKNNASDEEHAREERTWRGVGSEAARAAKPYPEAGEHVLGGAAGAALQPRYRIEDAANLGEGGVMEVRTVRTSALLPRSLCSAALRTSRLGTPMSMRTASSAAMSASPPIRLSTITSPAAFWPLWMYGMKGGSGEAGKAKAHSPGHRQERNSEAGGGRLVARVGSYREAIQAPHSWQSHSAGSTVGFPAEMVKGGGRESVAA